MTAIAFIRENRDNLALATAGVVIGLTSYSSAVGLFSRLVAGSIIATAPNNKIYKLFSAFVFTSLQGAAEGYLPQTGDPLAFLNKAVSVTVTGFPLYFLNRAAFLLFSNSSSSPLFMPILTAATLVVSLNSIRNIALAAGIFSEISLAHGIEGALFGMIRSPANNIKVYATFAAICTAATIAAFYFHRLQDPFVHICCIGATLLSPEIMNLKTFTLSFFATSAISFYSSQHRPLMAALFLFFHFQYFDLNNWHFKKIENLRKKIASIKPDISNKIKQMVLSYFQTDIKKQKDDEIGKLKAEWNTQLAIHRADFEQKFAKLRKHIKDLNDENAELKWQNCELTKKNTALLEEIRHVDTQSQIETLAVFAAHFFENDRIFKNLSCIISQNLVISPVIADHALYEEDQIKLWIKSKCISPTSRKTLTQEDIVYLPKLKKLIATRLEFYRKIIEQHQNSIPLDQRELLAEAYDELIRLQPKMGTLLEDLPREAARSLEALDLCGHEEENDRSVQPFHYLDLAIK